MRDNKSQNAASRSAKSDKNGSFDAKNKVLWSLLFVVIAVLSVWAVVSQTKNFSFSQFLEFIKNSNPIWLISAIVSMLGFIVFEGVALVLICNSFGYKRGMKHGFIYSAADIYFSAITPSATGGQPACAYFMIKDGIPAMFVTVALIGNLLMYTASIVFLGLFAVLVNLKAFFGFSALSKVLILAGIIAQFFLLTFFILLLLKKGLLHSLCSKVLKFLGKIRIVRNVDKKLKSLEKKMDEYSEHCSLLRGKGKLLFIVFLFNLLQRIAQTAVTPFTFLASGGEVSKAFDVFVNQIYVLVGANCVPIPGAMGVTDYLMLDSFKGLGIGNPEFLELFSRSLSFYMCIIICGLTVLFSYIATSKVKKTNK